MLWLTLAFVPAASIPPRQDVEGDVARLMRQLTSEEQSLRDEAMGELAALGESAREAVSEAADSKDPDLSTRARAIMACWTWELPPEISRRHPWLGAVLSSGALDKQMDAIEILLSFESDIKTPTLIKLATDRAADARVRRAAAIAVAVLGVKMQEAERPEVEPLSAEELKALGASPDLALIQRAALVLAAGELPARMKSLAALNDLAGGGLCRMESARADVPAGIAEMVLEEALYKWKGWWARNASRWGGEAVAPQPPTPIGSTDILFAAMLDDPGEVTRDEAGRVIQKKIAEVETFEYDSLGRLKQKRMQPLRIYKYAYRGLESARLASRFDEVGNRYDYTYDEHELLHDIAGPGGWRVQLIEGRPNRLIRDGAVMLEFP